MKKPRVTDFDPNAPLPELASPLEGMPAIERPAPTPEPKAVTPVFPPPAPERSKKDGQPPVRTEVRPSVVPSVRTPVRVRRTITRYAFEFFQDQIESLKQFSLDEKLRGEKGSMSGMVREALDMYIAKRNRTDG